MRERDEGEGEKAEVDVGGVEIGFGRSGLLEAKEARQRH